MIKIGRSFIFISMMILLVSTLFGDEVTNLNYSQDGNKGLIQVTYNIPKGEHQSYVVEDEFTNFFIEEPFDYKNKGVEFEATIYPNIEGKKKGDIVEYHDSVTLTKSFTITDDTIKEVKIEYGYNFCYDGGACQRPIIQSSTLEIEPFELAPEEKKLTSLEYSQEGNKGLISVKYTIPKGEHQSYEVGDEFANFFIEEPFEYKNEGVEFEATLYPMTEGSKAGEIVEYHDQVTLTKAFKIIDASVKEVKIEYGYNYCFDGGACQRPIIEEATIEILPVDSVAVANSAKEAADSSKVLYFLLLAFLGGLILNIMPCVLPVLSIKAMSLVNQAHNDKKHILMSSLAYTCGIVLSFIILASVVVGIKSTGDSLSWGFQFQNPWFVFSLLILIWVFTLSLYEVFQIRVPGMNMATQASTKGGHWGSFLSGIFAVLLATPCTAPLLAPAIGFAFQQPPFVIFSSFIMIGLGLAFPFILLGIFPKAIKFIPKPGNWMITFKEFMGFLLFGTAIYLLRTMYFLLDGGAFMNIIWFLLVLSIGCWIYGKFADPSSSPRKQWLWTIIALILIFGSGHFLIDFTQDGQAEVKGIEKGWETFTEEKLNEYRNNDEAVFIDFGAEWCLTCKTNETTVLHTEKIMKVFEDNNVKLLFGDNTRKNELVEKWLAKYERAGVPLYLYFAPGSDEAVVLPEVITNSNVTELFE